MTGLAWLLDLKRAPWSAEVKLLSRIWLCDPMDCSLPGSSVYGIFQARVLEWGALSFSRGSSRPRDRSQVCHIVGRHFTVWATRQIQDFPDVQKVPSRPWRRNQYPRGGKEMVKGCWAGKNKGTIIIKWLSLSEPARVSTHMYFLPNKYLFCYKNK